jgi:hypothetical protein
MLFHQYFARVCALLAILLIFGSCTKSTFNVDNARETGNTVTVTTDKPHNYKVGDTVVLSGMGVAGYNGTFVIQSIPSPTTFTYGNPNKNLPPSPPGGTVVGRSSGGSGGGGNQQGQKKIFVGHMDLPKGKKVEAGQQYTLHLDSMKILAYWIDSTGIGWVYTDPDCSDSATLSFQLAPGGGSITGPTIFFPANCPQAPHNLTKAQITPAANMPPLPNGTSGQIAFAEPMPDGVTAIESTPEARINIPASPTPWNGSRPIPPPMQPTNINHIVAIIPFFTDQTAPDGVATAIGHIDFQFVGGKYQWTCTGHTFGGNQTVIITVIAN